MATTQLGTTVSTLVGDLPEVGDTAPAYTLAAADNSDVEGPDGRTVLNIFPSVDTSVCSASVRHFNELAGGLPDLQVVCVSRDLPMALRRFCAADGIDAVTTLSAFRSDFGDTYGVTMTDGPMRGFFARAVIVIGSDGVVEYTQLVPDIGSEPDYDAVLAHLS